MLREDRELLADLKRVCNSASTFALEFMAGELSVEAEIAYAHRLVDVAELIMNHANARKRLVINGQVSSITFEPNQPPRLELE